MNFEWIKDNWFLVVALAAAFAAYVEWRVSDTVHVQVDKIDVVDSATLGLLQKDVEVLSDLTQETKARHDTDFGKVDTKLDKIIDILLAE